MPDSRRGACACASIFSRTQGACSSGVHSGRLHCGADAERLAATARSSRAAAVNGNVEARAGAVNHTFNIPPRFRVFKMAPPILIRDLFCAQITEGAGCKTRLESRINLFNHFMYACVFQVLSTGADLTSQEWVEQCACACAYPHLRVCI
jgi:hypothetical protein